MILSLLQQGIWFFFFFLKKNSFIVIFLIKINNSGGIQTGLDAFKALLLGADNIELGTQILVALGCTMAEVCHKGTCPVGVATTNQKLIDDKYKGSPIQLVNILLNAWVENSNNLLFVLFCLFVCLFVAEI